MWPTFRDIFLTLDGAISARDQQLPASERQLNIILRSIGPESRMSAGAPGEPPYVENSLLECVLWSFRLPFHSPNECPQLEENQCDGGQDLIIEWVNVLSVKLAG